MAQVDIHAAGYGNGRNRQIVVIQWLRALAAFAVVAWHAEGRWSGFTGAGAPVYTLTGQAGVDLFFVISGFVMWMTTADRPIGAMEFIKRRLTRIVPIYWFYTSLLVLGAVFAPAAFPNVDIPFAYVLKSYLFVPAVRPGTDFVWPVLGQGWTLNYEMFFYIVFAAAIAFTASLSRRLWTITLTLSALVAFGAILQPQGPIALTSTGPLLLEFLAGVWIAHAWNAGRIALPVPTALALAVSAIAAILASGFWQWQEVWRTLLWGAPAAVLLVSALALNHHVPDRPTLVSRMGDASYSIYLSHSFVIAILQKFMKAIGITTYDALLPFILLAFIASGLVGWLSYRFLELPVISAFRTVSTVRHAELRSGGGQ